MHKHYLARICIILLFSLVTLSTGVATSAVDQASTSRILGYTGESSNFNPLDFGAVGDGRSHKVGAVLNLQTLSSLASYQIKGRRLYKFISEYPFGILFKLRPHKEARTGDAVVLFRVATRVGLRVLLGKSIDSHSFSLSASDIYLTSDKSSIVVGSEISGFGIEEGTFVTGVAERRSGSWALNISKASMSAIPRNVALEFYIPIRQGVYTIPMVSTDGISQGDTVRGNCIQEGTQVDLVSHARLEVRLSAPTQCAITTRSSLTFEPSWFDKLEVGMNVSGPPNTLMSDTKLAAIDKSNGSITLTKPLIGALTIGKSFFRQSKEEEPQTLTFYRAYKDEEVKSLEMDRIGIQAAIEQVKERPSASVDLGSGGKFLLDAPIILPIYSPFGDGRASLNFGGGSQSGNGASLFATHDFGPGTALISCGDPTADSSNRRGLYEGKVGYFCSGHLHDLRLGPLGSIVTMDGSRPKWEHSPVAMDGVKEGPRLNWNNVVVTNFNIGVLAAIDHTTFRDIRVSNNYIGFRLDEQQPGLFGDEYFERADFSNNLFAGISVSSKAYISGLMVKPYLGSNPYAIYCEESPKASQCLQGVTIINGNSENSGCGFIKDGGIQDGWAGLGGNRGINDTRVINSFVSRNGFGQAHIPIPPGGCEWSSYIDVRYVGGLSIENVWPNDFARVDGAAAYVLRAGRLDGFHPIGEGGFHMSGRGVWAIVQDAQEAKQNIVTGPAGLGGEYYYSGSWQYVTLEGQGFRARPMPFSDPEAHALPIGAILDYTSTPGSAMSAVWRSRATAQYVTAGVSCQNWQSNPASLSIAPVVCFSGSRLPLWTFQRTAAGNLFKKASSPPGRAMPTTSVSDGPAIALALGEGPSQDLAYVKPLWNSSE